MSETVLQTTITGEPAKKVRKRVHTRRCGLAKKKPCVCVCGGAKHQELLSEVVDARAAVLMTPEPASGTYPEHTVHPEIVKEA